MPIPSKPYDEIAIDFQGPFPMSEYDGRSCDFLFNFLDCFSGEVIMVPCQEEGLTSQKCAEIFLRYVYPQWGLPTTIRSDRDIRFTSEFWKHVTRSLNTTLAMSSSFHPATNGKIERMHRVANGIFRILVREEQSDWAEHVPFVQFAINTSANKATGFSPFDLTKIRTPSTIAPWRTPPANSSATAFIEKAKLRQSQARDAMIKAQVEQTHFANKHRRPDHVPVARNEAAAGITNAVTDADPELGSLYWLSTEHLSSVPHRSRKWTPPYVGPFKCLHYNPATSSYTLDLPPRYTRRGINNVFHASKVKPYVPNDDDAFPQRLTSTVPVFPLDAMEIGIEKILSHKWRTATDDPEDRELVKMDIECLLNDGTLHTFTLPYFDIPNSHACMIEYRHRLALERGKTNAYNHWSDFEKVPHASLTGGPPRDLQLMTMDYSPTSPALMRDALPSLKMSAGASDRARASQNVRQRIAQNQTSSMPHSPQPLRCSPGSPTPSQPSDFGKSKTNFRLLVRDASRMPNSGKPLKEVRTNRLGNNPTGRATTPHLTTKFADAAAITPPRLANTLLPPMPQMPWKPTTTTTTSPSLPQPLRPTSPKLSAHSTSYPELRPLRRLPLPLPSPPVVAAASRNAHGVPRTDARRKY
jgi:hypothetical protein